VSAGIATRPAPGAAEQKVRAALDRVVDPCSIATGVPITLADMGLIAGVEVDAGEAVVHLRVTSPFCMHIGNMQERIVAVVGEVDGIREARVEVDDGMEWLPTMIAPHVTRRLREVRPFDDGVKKGPEE
jgi:metal-sulfur cluster biosynthetic enzyme